MDVPRLTTMRIDGAHEIDFAFLMISCLAWMGGLIVCSHFRHEVAERRWVGRGRWAIEFEGYTLYRANTL